MTSRLVKRHLSLCLVLVMLLTAMLPVSVFAAGSNDEGSAASGGNAAATTMISDYATFLSCFKVLEGYAQTYAEENTGEDANALIINYIRTGVERYTSGTWEMVCGKENTAFTAFVSEQDTANNTSASALKNLGNFTLPNGNKVDLGHVFGAMDVANYAKVQGMTDAVVQARADMGSWAGDITDLMYCAENVDIADKVDTTETDVDTLAANIRARYLGVDYGTLNSVDHSFTDTDLYGDGAERSCELTSAAVSRLFYDLPIPAYGSIYMQGIRQLVDSVGGVTVTPDASFSGFTAGQPVTLTGQRTENYIRYRADSTEGNNQRMQRQKQVVLALVNKMLAQVKEDPASVLALYNDVRRNITTNINTAMMVYLAQQASGMHFSGDIVNVPGTSVMGAQKHAEYQVDPDALLEMVLDIFYEPVDG